jgi:hypothetical protein
MGFLFGEIRLPFVVYEIKQLLFFLLLMLKLRAEVVIALLLSFKI